MKYLLITLLLIFGIATRAQNMVPNPGFETVSSYATGSALFSCVDQWKDNSYLLNPAMNSADLGYNGSAFFSSIAAYEGTRYAAMDCEQMNPEYIQVKMISTMVAGTTYCVSFYTSLFDQWNTPAPFLGAYFSNSVLTVNPYAARLAASVEVSGPTDATVWQEVSGTYTALGGESYITLGCFRGNPSLLSYMYIDMVDVHPMIPSFDLGADQTICSGEHVTPNAGNDGTGYLWSTGQTTSSIIVSAAGTYWVAKYSGACSLKDEIVFSSAGCNDPDPLPAVPAEPSDEEVVYIPNSFSPNSDGTNDLFGAKGEGVTDFKMIIYNRWGQTVFSSSNIADLWDGTFNHQPVAEAVYIYTINYRKIKRK